MNKPDKQEPDKQQSVIDDVTVNDARTTEIKGGSRPTTPVYNLVIDPRI